MSGGDRMLTTAEVAALFRVHRATVYRWAKAGILDVIQVGPGRGRRFRESEVRALLRGKEHTDGDSD